MNEEWISDKTRFIWDGLRSQRLDRPYVRKGSKLVPASWAEAFAAIKKAVGKTKPDRIGAIAGDLATVEEMYALKLLMQSLGSENIDCRQDGAALDPSLGRASYIFNPTIEGIEQADAVLIIGANPRFEASVLNARIRKRWQQGDLPVGVIGDVGDLRYDYEQLGAGPESLKALADGNGSFFETLKNAKHPLIIVGQGALARADGAAILGQAAKLAAGGRARSRTTGTVLPFCTRRQRASAASISASCPARAARTSPACSATATCCSCSAPTRSTWAQTGGAFVVYIGTHGDAGAHRANVILPGAAYTEKSGTYVNTEGRVQQTNRAGFAPGEAKEDWAILRALSDVLGKKLPFDSLADLRRKLYGEYPHLGRVDQIAAGDGGRYWPGCADRRPAEQGRVRLAGQGFLPDQSDRAGFRGHGRMFGPGQGRLQAGGGVGPMDSFFSFYVLPALIILLKSVVLIVVLLIFVAYILYADRKIWAAVQLRRGPNVVGPWGLLQAFADLLKFVFKEPVIPSGANKGVFLLAPLVSAVLALAAWAVIPVADGWGIANVNVGILYVFAISSLEVYGVIMGGWASNSKYPFLGALRSAAQMVSYEVSIGFVIVTVLLCVGSLNLTDIVLSQRDGLGTMLGLPNSFLDWHWLALFPMFIIFFISALAETNRPPFDLVEAESELVAGHMIEYSSTPFLLFFLGEYVAIVLMCALTTILFLGGWLPPFDFAPFTWVPGVIWFVLKVCMVFFMFSMVKAFVPRYRYDQLMRLGWKVFLPISLFMVVATAAFLKIMGLA